MGKIKGFLGSKRMRMHGRKLSIKPVRAGLTFVGYRIWPTHRLVRKDNIKRFLRRMSWIRNAYSQGMIDWEDIKPRLDSWIGHVKHTDSRRLIRRLSREWVFKRDGTINGSCSPRRQLEQQCEQLSGGKPQQQQPGQSEQQQRVSHCPALSANFNN